MPGEAQNPLSVTLIRGGKEQKVRVLNAIQKVVQEGNYSESETPKKPKVPTHKVDGPEGHWEYAIGKKFWVKTGGTIEDVVKRQKKPMVEIKNDMKRLAEWKQERLEEGIEDVGTYEQSVQDILDKEKFYDNDGKLLRSKDVTPQVRIKKFFEGRTGLLYQAAYDLAIGVFIEKVNATSGHRRVYQERPDTSMLKYLLDIVHTAPPGLPGRQPNGAAKTNTDPEGKYEVSGL